MKPFRSLRFKLIGAAIIVELVMLSLVVWNSMRLMDINLNQQMEHRLAELKPLLNASLSVALLQYDLVTMKEIMQQYRTDEVLYYAVYNAVGERLLKWGKPEVLKDLELIEDIDSQQLGHNGKVYSIGMPLRIIDQTVGHLELELDSRYITTAIDTTRWQGLMISGGAIVISAILLSLLGLALTRHLQELMNASQRMSQGDLAVRVRVASEDEIGQTARAFNQMADNISESQANLQAGELHVRQLNQELEFRVEQRTAELRQANQELQQSLQQLKQTQAQLVESEKMASLGDLVAGVAHEINTPLGIGVTAASHLNSVMEEYRSLYQQGELTRNHFEAMMDTASDSSRMILSNLERASSLIRSFKQVAVDQSSSETRLFNLKSYLDEILQSLQPKLKKTHINIKLSIPEDIEVEQTAGALYQVFTNLIMNSLTHAFDPGDEGQISIDYEAGKAETIVLRYFDNGKGMNPQTREKLFEPFFTTNRNQGGTGLGMHIVYNLVTQTLGGRIRCQSKPEQGTGFLIEFPKYFSKQTGNETQQHGRGEKV